MSNLNITELVNRAFTKMLSEAQAPKNSSEANALAEAIGGRVEAETIETLVQLNKTQGVSASQKAESNNPYFDEAKAYFEKYGITQEQRETIAEAAKKVVEELKENFLNTVYVNCEPLKREKSPYSFPMNAYERKIDVVKEMAQADKDIKAINAFKNNVPKVNLPGSDTVLTLDNDKQLSFEELKSQIEERIGMSYDAFIDTYKDEIESCKNKTRKDYDTYNMTEREEEAFLKMEAISNLIYHYIEGEVGNINDEVSGKADTTIDAKYGNDLKALEDYENETDPKNNIVPELENQDVKDEFDDAFVNEYKKDKENNPDVATGTKQVETNSSGVTRKVVTPEGIKIVDENGNVYKLNGAKEK